MQSNENKEAKAKRARIFKEAIIQGELVAKSYVDLDFRKNITKHIIHYGYISHSVVLREIVLR